MDKNDVVLGMKVVPKTKSIGCSLHVCDSYKEMKKKNQKFLYVTHQHACDKGSSKFLLSDDKTHIYLIGDYFQSEDFEPYIEED